MICPFLTHFILQLFLSVFTLFLFFSHLFSFHLIHRFLCVFFSIIRCNKFSKHFHFCLCHWSQLEQETVQHVCQTLRKAVFYLLISSHCGIQFLIKYSFLLLTMPSHILFTQAVGWAAGSTSKCQAERSHPGHHHSSFCSPAPNPHHWTLRYRKDFHPGTGCQAHSSTGEQQVGSGSAFYFSCFKTCDLTCMKWRKLLLTIVFHWQKVCVFEVFVTICYIPLRTILEMCPLIKKTKLHTVQNCMEWIHAYNTMHLIQSLLFEPSLELWGTYACWMVMEVKYRMPYLVLVLASGQWLPRVWHLKVIG